MCAACDSFFRLLTATQLVDTACEACVQQLVVTACEAFVQPQLCSCQLGCFLAVYARALPEHQPSWYVRVLGVHSIQHLVRLLFAYFTHCMCLLFYIGAALWLELYQLADKLLLEEAAVRTSL